MRSMHVTTLTHDPLPADRPARPDLHIVQIARSGRVSRALRVTTAALVVTGGYVHFCLYRHGYRTIPKIGVGFGLQVLTSAFVAIALLAGPHRVGRVAHLTDRLAAALTGVAAAGLAMGTLAAFARTRLPGGLFHFEERGLQPAPQALIALVAEIGVLVVAGAWLLAQRAAAREVQTVPTPGGVTRPPITR
jgi:hypothetical protein